MLCFSNTHSTILVPGSLNAVAVKAGGGGSRNKDIPKGVRSNRQKKKDTSSDFLEGPQQPGKYYFIILLLLYFFLKINTSNRLCGIWNKFCRFHRTLKTIR